MEEYYVGIPRHAVFGKKNIFLFFFLFFFFVLNGENTKFAVMHRVLHRITYEPPRDKTNKMACAPSEDSDQPVHPPSLIRAFAVHSVGS